ncbi:hypothetical protein G647_01638 [Cladophialophora carrionii CBS 160.54]|uniref:Uncharacterized protein n=1 Tax=Cladophialophora carrionii CBS 160.54 TaxID=1279043 RepID=V9DQM0_9EURO|nr:uncharacterized protein G647_01638 [Cladophialophora carrionii CBS 160.54]ETI29185.1 hypothetical protein G647_01638 [Cladophialophora carrionii CBS 160.54]
MKSPVFVKPPSQSPAEFYQSSPLMQAGSFESLAQLYDEVPQDFVELLNVAFQAAQSHMSVSGTPVPRPQSQYDPMSQLSLGAMRIQNPAPTHGIAFPPVVLQASRLATTIHLRAMEQGIPFEDVRNHDDVKHLGALLHESPLAVWRGIPYIYLWV